MPKRIMREIRTVRTACGETNGEGPRKRAAGGAPGRVPRYWSMSHAIRNWRSVTTVPKMKKPEKLMTMGRTQRRILMDAMPVQMKRVASAPRRRNGGIHQALPIPGGGGGDRMAGPVR